MNLLKAFSICSVAVSFFSVTSAMAREATTAGEKLYLSSVNSCDDAKVKDLVAKGVDPTVTSGGMTALHIAAYVNCSDSLISDLITLGIDPDQKDSNDQAPLHTLLVWNPQRSILDALLKGGANPNLIGDQGARVPIVDAAKFCIDCVEPLLKAGASPDVKNRKGERALALLIQKGQWKIAEILFKAGANPNELIPDDIGEVHPFCFALRVADPSLIDRLIGYGADPKILDAFGGNSLHCALRHLIRYGGPSDPNSLAPFEESVRKIVAYGLNLSDSAQFAASVLHQVARATYDTSSTSGYASNPQRYLVAIRLAKFFIGLGAPASLIDGGSNTPLAVLLTDRGMAEYHNSTNLPDFFALAKLLATPDAIKVIDRDGRTALMLFITELYGERDVDVEFVRYLIAQGIDLSVKDTSGKTAYELAMAGNLLNIAWEIEQHGGKP
jgi:ankyrin repeat protein